MEAGAPPPPPPPPPSGGGGRQIEVGRVLSETFSIYSANFGPLIVVALITFLISGLLQGLLIGNTFQVAIGLIISLLATTLYTGFVVKLVQDVRDERRDFSVGELINSASPHLGSLILNGILGGIAIAIGLILLLVPGFYLMTIWAVTAPASSSRAKTGWGHSGAATSSPQASA